MKQDEDETRDLPAAEAQLYAKFCELIVEHRLQADCRADVERHLAQSRHTIRRGSGSQGEIALLYGPTGVGKTALWDDCKDNCKSLHAQRGLPGKLPHLYTLCDVPSSGIWQMKQFYENTLEHADEMLINQKQLVTPITIAQASWTATTAGLRRATLNVLKHRQPFVFAIDEAHHLTIHSSEGQKDKNLDALKTFADEASVPILMIGSYELIDFRSRSGRLGRRVRPFHLPRYNIEKNEDQHEYKSVVNFFSERLGVQDGLDLNAEFYMLMDQTLGCVGLLKQWLERAYFRALWAGRRRMRRSDLQAEAPAAELVTQWLEEINTGEAKLREYARSERVSRSSSTKEASKTKARKRKPFQRTVVEDQVGEARHAKVAA